MIFLKLLTLSDMLEEDIDSSISLSLYWISLEPGIPLLSFFILRNKSNWF